MKFDLLSIIPYFGGASPEAFSLKETRLDYLLKTYDSLINISDKIIISVCTPEDLELINNLNLTCEIRNFEGAYPPSLPYLTVSSLQNKVQNTYVYFTDADEILYIKDRDMLFNFLDKNKYVVPHRFEKIYKQFGSNRGENVRFKSATYAVCNRTGVNSRTYEEDARFYVNADMTNAFGGGFLCHRDLFNRISFHESDDVTLEHIEGFAIFLTPDTICLKTNNVFDFFVEHLSGYEYHIRLSGENVAAVIRNEN